MVEVPTTGEKVRCPGCGQKFRFDVPPDDAPAEPPQQAPPAEPQRRDADEPPANQVQCPRCHERVDVPVTGEKVRCPRCGQKFRFDVPPDAAAGEQAPLHDVEDEEPGEPPEREPAEREPPEREPQANRVRCPRCQEPVDVPLTGEKVRCPRCGQKFRFDVPSEGAPADEADELPVLELEEVEPPTGGEPPAASDIRCPRCRRLVEVPRTGEKIRCPGCGQKFRFDISSRPPSPEAESAPLPGIRAAGALEADAAELRSLWPGLAQFLTQLYEEGEATDTDRRLYRSQVDRAGELARRVLPPPEAEEAEAHGFMTSVLREATLDEIVALSLEDFRHLRRSLDEAQALLDLRVPEPTPQAPSRDAQAAVAARRPPAAPRPALAILCAAAFLGVAIGGVVAMVVLGGRGDGPRERSWAELRGIEPRAATSRPAPATRGPRYVAPTTAGLAPVGPPSTRVGPAPPSSVTPTPVFVPPTPPSPEPHVEPAPPATPPPHVEPPPTPQPPVRPDTPVPTPLGPGVHTLFNHRDFTGWARSGAWALRQRAMVGRAGFGHLAVAAAGSPEWRDYDFKARGRLTRAGRMVREGEYFLVIVRYQAEDTFFCIRFAIEGIYELGYYRRGRWRETSRARHGLRTDFNKWHDIQISVRGDQLSLVIDGIGGKPPWPIPRGFARGGVALGVTGGEAAFDDVRIRLPR